MHLCAWSGRHLFNSANTLLRAKESENLIFPHLSVRFNMCVLLWLYMFVCVCMHSFTSLRCERSNPPSANVLKTVLTYEKQEEAFSDLAAPLGNDHASLALCHCILHLCVCVSMCYPLGTERPKHDSSVTLHPAVLKLSVKFLRLLLPFMSGNLWFSTLELLSQCYPWTSQEFTHARGEWWGWEVCKNALEMLKSRKLQIQNCGHHRAECKRSETH